MSLWDGFAALAWSTEVPLLPGSALAALYLHLGWSVVLAALGQRWGGRVVAVAVGLWAWVPGVWGVSHWLGLALQAPSVLAVLWCAAALGRAWRNPSARAAVPVPPFALLWSAALGWVLLADLLAWFPVSVYAWGFSPAVLGVLMLLALVPLVVPRLRGDAGRAWMLWPLALVVFVALRLPSGNAWDAVLDPVLWVVVQVVGLRQWRAARSSRPAPAVIAQEHRP